MVALLGSAKIIAAQRSASRAISFFMAEISFAVCLAFLFGNIPDVAGISNILVQDFRYSKEELKA